MIDDTRRKQELPREELRSVSQCDFEVVVDALCIGHLHVPKFDAWITTQLLARDLPKLRRVNPVACKKTVKRLGSRIAIISIIADENMSATPSKDQRGTETGWSTPNDNYIKHFIADTHVCRSDIFAYCPFRPCRRPVRAGHEVMRRVTVSVKHRHSFYSSPAQLLTFFISMPQQQRGALSPPLPGAAAFVTSISQPQSASGQRYRSPS